MARNTYLITTRDVLPNGSFGSEPGETHFLRVPPDAESFSFSHDVSQKVWTSSVIRAADGVEDEVTGSTGEILFFVHGYNNDVGTVLWRTRTLQETLAAQQWRGLVVGFDWPSANATLNYLEDRSDAAKVADRLVEQILRILVHAQFPDDSARPPCTINVHLLGHSTGAYVIMEAFTRSAKEGDLFRKPWRIAQVAFVGGDVSRDSLREDSSWGAPMFDRIMRLTNYSNRYDKVLGVSNMKRLGTAPRAGRVGVPMDAHRKVVNVDCSSYFATKDPQASQFVGTFNHSWHIGDPEFALDLAMTLEGSIDREALPTRKLVDGALTLVAGRQRPQYQQLWDADRPPASRS